MAVITDSSGSVKERYTYNAYGVREIVLDSGFDQVYGHTGRRHDDETGLQYFRARYYDADLGRFVGRDSASINIRIFVPGNYHVVYPVSGSGYYDGFSFYSAYFIPRALDPTGLVCEEGEYQSTVVDLRITSWQQGSFSPGVTDDLTDGKGSLHLLDQLQGGAKTIKGIANPAIVGKVGEAGAEAGVALIDEGTKALLDPETKTNLGFENFEEAVRTITDPFSANGLRIWIKAKCEECECTATFGGLFGKDLNWVEKGSKWYSYDNNGLPFANYTEVSNIISEKILETVTKGLELCPSAGGS